MAWRVEEQVVRGEIDNRTPGRVVGQIWFVGREEPVVLDLEGNPWRDLAGHVLKFSNPEAKAGDGSELSVYQKGSVGDITASRKVKVPECTMDELMEFYKAKQPFPWHWGNSFYLEWYSDTNGRVVIEAAHYQLELDGEPAWTMSAEDETAQQLAAAGAMANFMARMGELAGGAEHDDLEDDDEPRSPEEALADEEDEKMQLLLDRVTARLERGELDLCEFDRVYAEERARLMRERGEKDPELTPEEAEERRQWIEEMNAIAEEALVDLEAEKWKGERQFEDEHHPLVEKCSDLAVQLYHDVRNAGWVGEAEQAEHPLREIVNGVTTAGAKLAGALGMSSRYDEWPPERSIAGNVIVRLKKARGYLRDAISGLDSADAEGLATPEWRQNTRVEISAILGQTQELLREVREVLEVSDDDDDLGIF